MPRGQQLFTEKGEVIGLRGKSVLQEGVAIEVNFISKVDGVAVPSPISSGTNIGSFPSGTDLGSATVTQHAGGMVDTSSQGSLMTKDGQFMWWSHAKSKVVNGEKLKGVDIVTGFTDSKKLEWMNGLIIILETEHDPSFKSYTHTGYEYIV